MAKSKKRLRLLGAVSKVFTLIPDTIELIGKGIDNTRPIVEKYMDQRLEKQRGMRNLDNVINLPLGQAKQHLESLGFVVAAIPAKPAKHYRNAELEEVVAMSPKHGKQALGSLVKLYYITSEGRQKSQALFDQETLKNIERNQKIADTFNQLKDIPLPFKRK